MKKLLILAALIAAPIAHAEPAAPAGIKVSAAGLDLNNPADARMMIERLEAAVRPNCVAPGFAIRRAPAGCIRDALRDTVIKARIPQLTAALENRSPEAPPVLLALR